MVADAGQYHGLIALSDDASLLNLAAQSGDSPGCGDCVWTLIENCTQNSPTNGINDDCASAHHYPGCRKKQVAMRIYLSTRTENYLDEGVYCIGGGNHIVDVGDRAIADVKRYLKNVRPPDLALTFDPDPALAGLATKVAAAPPADLKPAPFGGDGVTETITISPVKETWRWGDGTADVVTPGGDDAANLKHLYATGGHRTTTVRTVWGATYTITYAGQTFGPYTATGRLTETQSAQLAVATSNPVLVSH